MKLTREDIQKYGTKKEKKYLKKYKTRAEQITAGGIDSDANFLGDDSEYRDWYVVGGRSRDSDALGVSNFKITLERLGGESKTVRIERYGHWAVGWVEQIYVKPNSKAYKIALDIKKELENYPILNDYDYYQTLEKMEEE